MKKLQEIDYINNTYGKLTILSLFIKDKKSYCTASCECGQIKEYVFASLKRGLTKSCGFLSKFTLCNRFNLHRWFFRSE